MYRLDVKFPFDITTYVAIGNKITAHVGKISDSAGCGFGERDMQFMFKTKELRAEAASRVRLLPIDGLKVIERFDLDKEEVEEDCGG